MEERKVTKKATITSNRIAELLQQKKMSRTELADLALNGNYGFLTNIINGKKNQITLPTAIRIAQVLEKPVEEVFIYVPEKEN